MLEKLEYTYYISEKQLTVLYVPSKAYFRIYVLTTQTFNTYLKNKNKYFEEIMLKNNISNQFIPISDDFIQYFCSDYSAGSKLSLINIEVCDNCNFNCLHCYYDKKNKGNSMTLENFKQVLHELSDFNEIDIKISGGEPTLNEDIVEICKLTMKKPSINEHSIISNASAPLQKLKDILATGINMQISIYGFSEQSYCAFTNCTLGTFSEIKKKLISLNDKEKKQIKLIFYDNLITHKEVDKFKNFAYAYGYSFKISGYNIIGNAKNFKDKLELANYKAVESLKNDKDYTKITLGCRICHLNRINIEVNGNITPCPFFHDRNNKFIMGKLFYTKILDAYNSEKFKKFKNLTVNDVKICNECSLKYVCTAGCCGETYSITGSILEKYTKCQKNLIIKKILPNKLFQIIKYAPSLIEVNEVNWKFLIKTVAL